MLLLELELLFKSSELYGLSIPISASKRRSLILFSTIKASRFPKALILIAKDFPIKSYLSSWATGFLKWSLTETSTSLVNSSLFLFLAKLGREVGSKPTAPVLEFDLATAGGGISSPLIGVSLLGVPAESFISS